MNAFLRRLAILLTVPVLSSAIRAADKPTQGDIPAPDWVKMIDQGDNDPRLKGYKTPEGIKVEIVAEGPALGAPLAMTFADDGTPYVLERRAGDKKYVLGEATYHYKDGSKHVGLKWTSGDHDAIKTLSDTKGKGVYDQSQIVLEDETLNALLVHDGWLYICGQGTVRRYKQSKGEGAYDVKEIVAQGFGYPDVCGAAVGPDGRLYVGAVEADNFVEGSDGSRATVLHSGAVFRCRPDGSKMETYAIGFIDPTGSVSFDAVGNLFHADGGYFPTKPGKFNHRRLMHVVEGADFGWRTTPGYSSAQADPFRATIDGGLPGRLPPMLTTGEGFGAGLLIYNDTRLPENFRGLILASDHERQSVLAYKVERKGATFAVAAQFDFLTSNDWQFVPRQPVLGPDGAIYVADTRDVIHGRIYRLTWAGTKDQPALPPRGMDSWAKIAKLGDDDLVKALASEDGSDRDHARFELARRGEKNRSALLKLLKDADQPDAPRIAALGALESMWNDDVQATVLFVLEHDSSADLRRLTADAVGLNAAKGDGDVHAVLLRALNDPAPEVRRSVALAMSHVAADGAPDNLVNTWAVDDGRDAYLRDGLVRAVENLGAPGVDRLIALGESGVQKDTDKVVQAFLMMRTRPTADAIPRLLESPHLSVEQRAALIRSYGNYLLDPPLSLTPVVDYLIAHPKEDAAVKQAAAETLAALGVGPEDARRVGQAFVDGKLPPETRPQVTDILRRRAETDAECARLLKEIGGK